ncbi:NlpC/P60 family protein [Ferdinandcohnia quinoae]|uniref:NlpC/P60 family protein n=1 Tax=Fredinandcohnia quinoae TaxID=2918902 RepID=A0AAW5E7Z7_9BACI|nr:NlpC/P60 family protein [Fredinandcohnia sp. SECRCQ15]MCH1627365.1 NlpC/P60 family protein [Fredinandcohnia sp. SECRCQ15]
MKKSNVTREALVVTSIAAGFFFGAPLVADASEQNLDPTQPNTYQFNTNQILRYGHTGYSVRFLQFELKKQNFYYETIDGLYGPQTQDAVRRFQKLYDLKIDGIAGVETLQKLNDIILKPKPKFLGLGDEGPEVEQIQEKLMRLNYYNGKIDGIFGKVTESSIISYQEKYKIVDTKGLATEETIDHILKNKNIKGPTIRIKKVQVASTNSVDSSIISIAMNYLGVPYVWGGTSPSGFDCSGYLQYVFAEKGITIPRTVAGIWNHGQSVEKLSVGDVVFFQTYKKGPSHAGIYIGNGNFIHSGLSNGISIASLDSNYWKSRYLGAKRIG